MLDLDGSKQLVVEMGGTVLERASLQLWPAPLCVGCLAIDHPRMLRPAGSFITTTTTQHRSPHKVPESEAGDTHASWRGSQVSVLSINLTALNTWQVLI